MKYIVWAAIIVLAGIGIAKANLRAEEQHITPLANGIAIQNGQLIRTTSDHPTQ